MTVNLKALAQRLSLSEGTVSRALNNYPDISEKTRTRVRELARSLDYQPNPTARRLATGHTETIGYVLPAATGHLTDAYIPELLDGLAEALSERSYDLLVTTARTLEDEVATIKRFADTDKVGGMVVSRTLTVDPRIETLLEANLPFVVFGRTADPSRYAWLDIDSERAFVDAVNHLVSLGHLRIAHIGGDTQFNCARLRAIGFRRGLEQNAIALYPGHLVRCDLSERGGYEAMLRLLSLQSPPSAVVCVSDAVALGALRAVRKRGLRPGEHVSVIGYDSVNIGEFVDPPLTTMAQPKRRAGRWLGERLLALIDGAEPADLQELWRAALCRRSTDGPPVAIPGIDCVRTS